MHPRQKGSTTQKDSLLETYFYSFFFLFHFSCLGTESVPNLNCVGKYETDVLFQGISSKVVLRSPPLWLMLSPHEGYSSACSVRPDKKEQISGEVVKVILHLLLRHLKGFSNVRNRRVPSAWKLSAH